MQIAAKQLLFTSIHVASVSDSCLPERSKLKDVGNNLMIRPCSDTYVYLLRGCKGFADGKWVHAHMIISLCKGSTFLLNTLLIMYAKNGNLKDAIEIFDTMPQRNVFGWTTLLGDCIDHGRAEAAFALFRQLEFESVTPDKVTFISLLKACTKLESLELGKLVHACIIEYEFVADVSVSNFLIDMYIECGSIRDADQAFHLMPSQDVVSWNTIIAGYVRNDETEIAVHLFRKMENNGLNPNTVTFVSILSACNKEADLESGKQIHMNIIKSGCGFDVFVNNALIGMYSKCGSIDCANQVFERMPTLNAVSWNSMIAGNIEHREDMRAIELFRKMIGLGIDPNTITFVSVLTACTRINRLEDGKWVHTYIIKTGLGLDVFVGSMLVDMYSKCGEASNGFELFDRLDTRDVISWNSLVAGYCKHGGVGGALRLMSQMFVEGVKPNNITLVTILNACARASSSENGKLVHAWLKTSGQVLYPNVGNALIDMYAKSGSMVDAGTVFESIHVRDVVSWTTMITGYQQYGSWEESLMLYSQMLKIGIYPNKVTFISVLNALASIRDLGHGKHVHAKLTTCGFEDDLAIGNALIDMYAKCGCLMSSNEVFDRMTERNVISWTVMVAGYIEFGDHNEALKIHIKMHGECLKLDPVAFVTCLNACAFTGSLNQGRWVHAHIISAGHKLNISVGSALIDMYVKAGSIYDAVEVFNRIDNHNVVSWTAIILGYGNVKDAAMAIDVFERMKEEGIEPDKITLLSVLNVCAGTAALEGGRLVHNYIRNSDYMQDLSLNNYLIDMYASCGSIEEAHKVFTMMPIHDVISWSTMVAGYCRHGNIKMAFIFFEEMQREGMMPNEFTFISILSVCSHVGMVDGHHYMHLMCQGHNITPMEQHYACLIDLLARVGFTEEAVNIIQDMPFQPTCVVWTTLLGACRMHGNLELAKHAAKEVLKLDPYNASAFLLLANAYLYSVAELGRF